MSEIPSYKRRRRAENVAFSPEFRRRLKEIRCHLGIPESGFPKDIRTVEGPPEEGFPKKLSFYPVEATRWYAEHIQKVFEKQHEELPRNLPLYYWYFPREIAELIEDFAYSKQPCRPGFYPEVPLDRYAMDMVREFGLPEDVVDEVKHHILVEENSGFGVSPKVQPIIIPLKGQESLELFVMIAGIDGSTTKKDWENIWGDIKIRMKQLGIKVAPTKRDEEKISIRDLTWWSWSNKGLSAKQIADNWERKYPGEAYGEDTILAAIKRIEKEMNPIS